MYAVQSPIALYISDTGHSLPRAKDISHQINVHNNVLNGERIRLLDTMYTDVHATHRTYFVNNRQLYGSMAIDDPLKYYYSEYIGSEHYYNEYLEIKVWQETQEIYSILHNRCDLIEPLSH